MAAKSSKGCFGHKVSSDACSNRCEEFENRDSVSGVLRRSQRQPGRGSGVDGIAGVNFRHPGFGAFALLREKCLL